MQQQGGQGALPMRALRARSQRGRRLACCRGGRSEAVAYSWLARARGCASAASQHAQGGESGRAEQPPAAVHRQSGKWPRPRLEVRPRLVPRHRGPCCRSCRPIARSRPRHSHAWRQACSPQRAGGRERGGAPGRGPRCWILQLVPRAVLPAAAPAAQPGAWRRCGGFRGRYWRRHGPFRRRGRRRRAPPAARARCGHGWHVGRRHVAPPPPPAHGGSGPTAVGGPWVGAARFF
eukprot:scaffold24271_cov112-Isochrysis_galbana.AAC.3